MDLGEMGFGWRGNAAEESDKKRVKTMKEMELPWMWESMALYRGELQVKTKMGVDGIGDVK